MEAVSVPRGGEEDKFKTVPLAVRGRKYFINSLKVQNKTQISL